MVNQWNRIGAYIITLGFFTNWRMNMSSFKPDNYKENVCWVRQKKPYPLNMKYNIDV